MILTFSLRFPALLFLPFFVEGGQLLLTSIFVDNLVFNQVSSINEDKFFVTSLTGILFWECTLNGLIDQDDQKKKKHNFFCNSTLFRPAKSSHFVLTCLETVKSQKHSHYQLYLVVGTTYQRSQCESPSRFGPTCSNYCTGTRQRRSW